MILENPGMMVESVDTTDLNSIEPMRGNRCWDALKFGETSAERGNAEPSMWAIAGMKV